MKKLLILIIIFVGAYFAFEQFYPEYRDFIISKKNFKEKFSNHNGFDNCGLVSVYENKEWFSKLQKFIEAMGEKKNDILEMCLSESNDMALFTMNNKDKPFVYKFTISSGLVSSSFTTPLNNIEVSGLRFGRREGDKVWIGGFVGDPDCFTDLYFNYSISKELIEIKGSEQFCTFEGNV